MTDIRWHRCDIKTTNLLANVLAQAEALEKQADDAIFLRNGSAREGAASNLFIVLDGLLITPPNSDELLPGITRDLLLELAADAGIAHAEASISERICAARRRSGLPAPRARSHRWCRWTENPWVTAHRVPNGDTWISCFRRPSNASASKPWKNASND